MAASIGARGAKVGCMDPELKFMSGEQIQALHVCKHEILAAIYRLYMVVPEEKADVILGKFFSNLPE